MASLIGKIEPGDVVGRCRIVRELGRGGVGTVYLATHQTLQIEVALKILSPSLSLENPALAERFIREAQLAARIRHPHVIAVMDAAHDEATGLNYIVQEYVGGGALSWHLRNGPLPEAKALAIIAGIAEALVIAEESGIVHRDIKPDNIMLDRRGVAKLADLGLAKHQIDAHTSLTIGGSFMGTPAYMSPEQARDAKAADTRDDIYSLGATFYECLTGEPPFRGETPYNIMSELLTKPSPKPRAHRPELSRSVDLVCRKMMAKTRGLRYATAHDLVTELHLVQALGDSGIKKLAAATFESDSIMARQQAKEFGIEPSVDGLAYEGDHPLPANSRRSLSNLQPPRQTDRTVFRTALILIGLVTIASLAIVWMGPHQNLHKIKGRLLQAWTGLTTPAAPAVTNIPPSPVVVENPPPAPVPEKPPVIPTAPIHHEPETTAVQPPAPVALPVVLPVTTNIDNAVPMPPAELPPAPPAVPTQADSAFVARSVAESSLGDLSTPTGHAELLRLIGKHTSGVLAPTTWTYYFYDTKAFSNARIVTVRAQKVVKNGEDILHPLDPYHSDDVLPDEKLLVDSNQALQIAQELIPDVPVSSSQLELVQKNWVPTWKVTLWAKDGDGGEEELGTVNVLAEKGVVSSNTLKPERVKHP